jgi:hypothetical protein
MTQFVAWVLFPLVLALLALGCGLLLQAASGVRLPEGLVIPAGVALIIVVGEVLTKSSSLARATTPVTVALAVIGFAVSRPWAIRPPVRWGPLIPALGVYLVYLAPVLFSGDPTFTGFIKLDDTATWMGMTDQVLKTGHAISSLPLSTYEAMLGAYLRGGEPVGSLLPWGIAHQIVGQDLAWEFQPYLAFLGAMMALAAWTIARPFVRSTAVRGLVAFVAAQAALIYGYSLWGGIKEVAAALLVVVSAACLIPIFESGARVRSFLPLAAATFGMLGINGYAGGIWLPITLLVAGVTALRIWLRERAWPQLAALAVAALAVLVLLAIRGGNIATQNTALTSSTEFGNLAHRVRPLQLFGVWPAADFRLDPPNAPVLTYLLIAIVFAGICFSVLIAWRERSGIVPALIAAAGVGAILATVGGSPWIQGKAFATASPALLLAGLTGAAALFEDPARLWATPNRPRGEGVAVARGVSLAACVAVAVGVLWGNALAYGHVTLAPYGQMSELSYIGQRFAGAGPTMINENEPYAGRHFLRLTAAESPSDVRRRVIPLRNGDEVPKGGYADLDQFQLAGLLVYRTIVMRTSPVASRPPSPYRLVYNGTWYQVWQRPAGSLQRPVLDSLALGDQYNPAGVPACDQVSSLAREAGPNGLLAAAARTAPTVITVPAQLASGETIRRFRVAAPGQYVIWLGGSLVGHLVTSVDGKRVGSTHEVISEPGGYLPLARLRLSAGVHTVVLSYGGPSLAPGSAGPSAADPPFTDGPLVISPPAGEPPVTYVSPKNYRDLCRQSWDWVEALGS